MNDSEYGRRMKGLGNIAEQVTQQFKIARKKYLSGRTMPKLTYELHEQYKYGQMKLF